MTLPDDRSPLTLTLRLGRLYVPREIYDRYFAGLSSVVLLRRDADLLIMPVRHAAAGGHLLKIRNAAGDRLVEAADFFRAQGIDDARELPVAWRSADGALVAPDVFQLHT